MYWFVRSEREVERLQPPRRAGDAQRLRNTHLGGQPENENHDSGHQAEDNQYDLLDVGPRHRLDAAEHRVESRRQRNQQHGVGNADPQHDGQHDRRRRDHDAERHAAGEEKQEARERARLGVEPLLQILVRGVDPGLVEERHERHRQHDHRERQRVVELQKPHAVRVALAGRADHGDGAQLRRHHGKADRPPRQASACEKVPFELVAALREAQTVPDDPGQIDRDDRPVDRVHLG